MMPEHIIVVSHRRSGTHLTIDSITNNFEVYSKNPNIGNVTLNHLTSRVNKQKYITIEQFENNIESSPCVIKTHSHSDLDSYFGDSIQLANYVKDLFSRSKVIYVYRDGRDVLVSLYFYMQSYDPRIKKISFSEFIRMDNGFDHKTYAGVLSRTAYWKFHVESWINARDVLLISFDDIVRQYDETIIKIAGFIDQPVNKRIKDLRMVKANSGSFGKLLKDAQDALIPVRFQKRLRSRFKRLKRSSVSFREGRSKDWQNYFTEEDLSYFNKQAGDLRERLCLDARSVRTRP